MKFKKIELLKIPFFNFLLIGGTASVVLLLDYLGINSSFGSYYMLASLLPIAILAAFIILDKHAEGRKISEYGFRMLKSNDYKYIFYSLLAVFPIAFLSRVLTPSFDYWYSNYLQISSSTFFIQFLLIYIPLEVIIEELGERALFQSRLSSFFGGRAAVYVTTLNFVALHIPQLFGVRLDYQLVMLFTWFFYALILSLLFEYTKNVYSTLLLHFLIDFISTIQIFLHLNFLPIYETILWSVWATLLILNWGGIMSMLEKMRVLKQIKLSGGYEFYLFLLSVPCPIFIFLILTLDARIGCILLGLGIAYFVAKSINRQLTS